MADQLDVEEALVALLERAVPPDQIGAPVRVYRGWPVSAALRADLAVGAVHITIFPDERGWERLTPFPVQWQLPGDTGLSVTVDGDMVTLAGVADGKQLVGLLADGIAYVHRTTEGESAAAIAACLATMVQAERNCAVLNSTLRCPGARGVVARAATDLVVVEEVARQRVGYQLVFWCPSPELRDAAAGLAESAIAQCWWVDLPDGSAARLLASSSETIDKFSDADLYRRNLHCTIEFATTRKELKPAMLFGDLHIGGSHIRYS